MAYARKKWSELSERTKKAKTAKGITPEINDESYRRGKKGGWAKLSTATQKRYAGKGVTAAAYASGVSLKDARGHLTWKERAIRANILDSINKDAFNALPDDIANDLGKKWIDGFMSKSRGPLEPVKMTDWRYGRPGFVGKKVRYQTDEQIEARTAFINFLDENPDFEMMSDQDWKKYRENYMSSFTKQ